MSYSYFICDCCNQVFLKLQINILLPFTNVLNLGRSEVSLSLCHIAFLTLLFLLLLRLLLTRLIEVADLFLAAFAIFAKFEACRGLFAPF